METMELKTALEGFSGTEQYHQHGFFRGLVLTDGCAFLRENANCFWLLDLIGSYQPKCRADEMLRNMQFWTLKVQGSKATLVCERDSGDVAITKKIGYTDFPLDEIRIWVEAGACGGRSVMVAMLPGER